MADRVRKVDYFKTMIPNRAGQGAKAFALLKDAGVNLLAMHGFPTAGRAQVDLVPEKPGELRRAARRLRLKLGPRKSVFLIEGDDRPGAVTGILKKLGGANINVVAVSATRTGRRYSGLVWVKPRDVARAARVLKAR